jgi:hypothetical protein
LNKFLELHIKIKKSVQFFAINIGIPKMQVVLAISILLGCAAGEVGVGLSLRSGVVHQGQRVY